MTDPRPSPEPYRVTARGHTPIEFTAVSAPLASGGRADQTWPRPGHDEPFAVGVPSSVSVPVTVPLQDPPQALVAAVEAMDAFVDGEPADPVVLIETAGVAVQMRRCFTPGAVYPPFPSPGHAVSGPAGLATAMHLLLTAAREVPDPVQGVHLVLLWRELYEHLPEDWAPIAPPSRSAPPHPDRWPDP